MKRIATEIHINSAPERVWQILTAFAEHGRWNPFFESIAGEAKVAGRLRVKFRQGITMHPRVTEVQEGRTLEWLGHLGIPGIFDGRHRFELEPEGDGTRLRHSEKFSGLLVPFTGGMLRATAGQFEALNRALKAEAERPVQP